MLNERITFLVSKEMRTQLEKLAKADKRTLGAYLRILIEKAIERKE